MSLLVRHHVTAIAHPTKHVRHLGMRNGFSAVIDQEVLLRHVRFVRGRSVFRQQVIEGLILGGADILRDGLPPFLRIVEYRVHIKDDPPKRIDTELDDLPDLELGGSHGNLLDIRALEYSSIHSLSLGNIGTPSADTKTDKVHHRS